MVFGSTLPTRLPRKSTYHGTPCELMRMPYGYVLSLGVFLITMSPVSVLMRPTCPDCSVKNRLPLAYPDRRVWAARARLFDWILVHFPRARIEHSDHAL